MLVTEGGERAVTQARLAGSVVAIFVMLLMLLRFRDNPYHLGSGSLRPIEMERTLKFIDVELAIAEADLTIPCDTLARPR